MVTSAVAQARRVSCFRDRQDAREQTNQVSTRLSNESVVSHIPAAPVTLPTS